MLETFPQIQKKWSIDDGRAVEPTPGAGCDSSYLLKLSRGERQAQSLVEFAAPSTLTSVGIARQALAHFLGDDEPPRRLVVGVDGKSHVIRDPDAPELPGLESGEAPGSDGEMRSELGELLASARDGELEGATFTARLESLHARFLGEETGSADTVERRRLALVAFDHLGSGTDRHHDLERLAQALGIPLADVASR